MTLIVCQITVVTLANATLPPELWAGLQSSISESFSTILCLPGALIEICGWAKARPKRLGSCGDSVTVIVCQITVVTLAHATLAPELWAGL